MNTLQERVVHHLDPSNTSSHIPLFLPCIRISRSGAGGGTYGNEEDDVDPADDVRPFTKSDLDRVMDYNHMPEPPTPCALMHCEAPGSGIENFDGDGDDDVELEVYDGGISFPKRLAKLSGGYIFLTSNRGGKDKVDSRTSSSNNNTINNDRDESKGTNGDGEISGKIACIPLQGCTVELPPGGRRVFREHAHTGARKGYEMAIHVRHSSTNENSNNSSNAKMTCYIILDTLGHRESWASAIRLRCDVGHAKFTILRPGGIAGSRLMSVENDGYYADGGAVSGTQVTSQNNATTMRQHQGKKLKVRPKSVAKPTPSSGNADLDAAIERFGVHGFKEEAWLHEFLQHNSVIELQGECDKLERWIDVIKDGMRGAVLEQYEYFVEASREMSTMGREVAWIRSLVERQQETLMSMRNIDFGNGLEEIIEDGIVGDEEFGDQDDDEEDGLLGGDGNDDMSDASSVDSSSTEDESGPMVSSRTPMRTNLRNPRRRESRQKGSLLPMTRLDDEDGPHPMGSGSTHPSHIEIPSWITDVCEEITAFIKESRYTDATELILKAKTEVSGTLAAHEQPTPPVVTTPTSAFNTTRNTISMANAPTANSSGDGVVTTRKVLHKKQQALLHRTNEQLDTLMERMSCRLAENLRRKNEALKASAKRERADPLSTLASLVSPICLNDDAVALSLLVKLGKYQEAATAYAARRSLLLSECLHERPISSPVGMDAVIYAAQISSSFFSSLAIAVEGFLDLFIDSNADGTGNDDDTSLNSRSLALGTGGKRVPSGALSAIVLWCDSELVFVVSDQSKFTNAFGSTRLLGSLALSPPGIRRPASQESSKNSLSKEREHSIEVAAKCINQAFAYASENLDTIGLSLTPKLAENMRPKLKGCESEVAVFLDTRWKAVTFDWTVDYNIPEMHIHSRQSVSPRSPADDRRV